MRGRINIAFPLLVFLLALYNNAAQAQTRPQAQRYEEPQPAQLKAEPKAQKTTQPSHAAERSSDGGNDLAALNRRLEQLRGAGKYAEAIPVAQRVLAVTEQKYGRDHPAVAVAVTNLAELYFRLRRYAEAEPLYKRALAIREKSLGPDGPDVAISLHNLAALYQAQGRAGEAEPLTRRALDIQKKAASGGGSSHGPTFQSERRLAPAPAASPPGDRSGASPAAGARPEAAPPPPPVREFRYEAPAAAPRGATTGSPTEARTDWDVVPVFYGTDRGREPNVKRVSYSADRGHRLELGRALVTVPKSHQVPQIERPWAIRIPYFDVTIYEQAEDPKKHFTLQEIKSLSKEDFLRLVHDRLVASSTFKDHAIVFVHGYNTSFDNALYRTAQIAYDLRFDGAPFVYCWPSGGGLISYTYDRESAEASEPYLRQFLDLVVKETGAKTISIIAHSMGNVPLLDVLKDMNSVRPPGVVISQIILAAPDVDADNFTILAQRIAGLAKGITLYAADNDRALSASHTFWGNYRAGDVPASGPLIVPGVDTIDISAASTDVFALNHSDYAESNDVLNDLGRLIERGVRPPDLRFDKLKPVTSAKGIYWRYAAP